MIKALIVDDEQSGCIMLQHLLNDFCPDVQVLGTANSVAAAVESISARQPNLVFLDIKMPLGDGFDLLKHFRPGSFQVIVTTAHESYAVRAFRVAATDYLLKPIDPDELQAAMAKFRSTLGRSANDSGRQGDPADQVAVPTLQGYTVLKLSDIIRLDAEGVYTTLHLADGSSILVSTNIGELDQRFAGRGFYRVHNSHVVNLRHVLHFIRSGAGYLVMSDGSHVNVSRRKRESFLRLLHS